MGTFCDQEDLQNTGRLYGKNLKQFDWELTPLMVFSTAGYTASNHVWIKWALIEKILNCLNSRDPVQLHSVHPRRSLVLRHFCFCFSMSHFSTDPQMRSFKTFMEQLNIFITELKKTQARWAGAAESSSRSVTSFDIHLLPFKDDYRSASTSRKPFIKKCDQHTFRLGVLYTHSEPVHFNLSSSCKASAAC